MGGKRPLFTVCDAYLKRRPVKVYCCEPASEPLCDCPCHVAALRAALTAATERAEAAERAAADAEAENSRAQAAVAHARLALEADDRAIVAVMDGNELVTAALSEAEKLRREALDGIGGKLLLDEITRLESKLAEVRQDRDQVATRREQAFRDLAASEAREQAARAETVRLREALGEIAAIAHDPDPEVQAAIAAGEHPPEGAPCPTCDIERIARRALSGAGEPS